MKSMGKSAIAQRVLKGILISVVCFLVLSVVFSEPISILHSFVLDSILAMAQNRTYPPWVLSMMTRAGVALPWIPLMVISFVFFAYITRGLQPDGHLHCLECGQILKGLSEPRCPECGVPI